MSFFTESVLATALRPQETAGPADPRRLRVMAVLAAVFNVMALNGVLVIACLPIVTAPAALRAAMVALDGWREAGDDRVVRQFIVALRDGRFWRTTLAVGAPLVATVLAAEEIIYFSRAANAGNAVGIGLGIAGLLLALSSSGYVLVLGARQPDLRATDTWFAAVSLAARNPLVASPLLAAELAAGLLVLSRDPSLAVIGLPVGLLALVRQTALRGLSRAGDLIDLDAGDLIGPNVETPDDREVER